MDLHDSPAEAAFRAEAQAFLHAHAGEGKLDYFAEEVSTAELLSAAKRWQRTLYESGWPHSTGRSVTAGAVWVRSSSSSGTKSSAAPESANRCSWWASAWRGRP